MEKRDDEREVSLQVLLTIISGHNFSVIPQEGKRQYHFQDSLLSHTRQRKCYEGREKRESVPDSSSHLTHIRSNLHFSGIISLSRESIMQSISLRSFSPLQWFVKGLSLDSSPENSKNQVMNSDDSERERDRLSCQDQSFTIPVAFDVKSVMKASCRINDREGHGVTSNEDSDFVSLNLSSTLLSFARDTCSTVLSLSLNSLCVWCGIHSFL